MNIRAAPMRDVSSEPSIQCSNKTDTPSHVPSDVDASNVTSNLTHPALSRNRHPSAADRRSRHRSARWDCRCSHWTPPAPHSKRMTRCHCSRHHSPDQTMHRSCCMMTDAWPSMASLVADKAAELTCQRERKGSCNARFNAKMTRWGNRLSTMLHVKSVKC